jgi:hypothetical protein
MPKRHSGAARRAEPGIHNHRSLGVLLWSMFCKVGGYEFRLSLAEFTIGPATSGRTRWLARPQ